MPGDLVGLQASLLGEMQHCVQSVTHMRLCVFSRSELWTLFRSSPARSYDLTWLAACEEHFLGDMLATIGRRSGLQRLAWGLLTYFNRAEKLELAREGVVPMPFRQQDLADALGLSLVHTNKTLRRLRDGGMAEISGGFLRVYDRAALETCANMDASPQKRRPLL
jgi:CRP-like cAMP-binding protein